ncbi:hypothetical protein [Clostridium perfringens]
MIYTDAFGISKPPIGINPILLLIIIFLLILILRILLRKIK